MANKISTLATKVFCSGDMLGPTIVIHKPRNAFNQIGLD